MAKLPANVTLNYQRNIKLEHTEHTEQIQFKNIGQRNVAFNIYLHNQGHFENKTIKHGGKSNIY